MAGPIVLAAPALAAACAPVSAFDGTSTVLTFTNTAACTWTVPTGVSSADVLVVGGGGGGSGSTLGSSAGGGAGGYRYTLGTSLTAGNSVSVTAGAGGAPTTGLLTGGANGANGSGSAFGSLTALGGGGGGGATLTNGLTGGSGGSGGGGGVSGTAGAAGASTAVAPEKGFAGGAGGATLSLVLSGGGGGGAGGAGGAATTVSLTTGTPGAGLPNSITGAATTYAMGGAALNAYLYPGGTIGSTNPTAGGGGRASGLGNADAGNTGIVVVRFTTPPTAPVLTAASATATATAGTAYSYTYAASGPPAPTFTVASGSLPAGLSLNSTTGVLSGTPTTAGTSTFTVTAANGVSPAATSGTQTITVRSVPAFTAASPPSAAGTGVAYSYTFTASGSPAPVFAVASGSLPLGLSLSSAGVLSGTPSLPGTSNFTVSATNAAGAVTTGTLSITVATVIAPVLMVALPPTTASVGSAYTYTFSAVATPAATWSVASGSLPAGLTLNPTTGVLSGTPTTAGTSTFTVRATNAGGTLDSGSITITTTPAQTVPAFVNQSPPTTATALSAYSGYTFTASGYPAPVFTVSSGLLPLGMTLNTTTGALTGTPAIAGSYPLTIAATNTNGTATSTPFTLVVAPTPVAPILILASPTTTGTAGTAYPTYTFTATGIPAPTFSLGSGALPPGLTLTSAGVLSGTPTTAGTYTFRVIAGNSQGTDDSGPLTITVAPTPVAPVFTASSPPTTGTALQTYGPYTFTASGTPAPTFAVASGSLPLGLSLSGAGVLSGTPLFSGTSTFAVSATNSAGSVSTATITLTVAPTPVAPLFILPNPPTGGTVGSAYGPYTFTATGVPAPVFSLGSGSLPPGVTLSSAGVLSGTPTTTGSYSFTASATNSAGTATTSTYTIVVDPTPVAPTLVNASPPSTGTVNQAYSYTFTALGIPAPTFAVASGTLPLGLSLSSAGVLSGTPFVTGTQTFTVSATNSAGGATTPSLSITVGPAPAGPTFLLQSPPTTATAGTAYAGYTFTALGIPAPVFSVASGTVPPGLGLTSAGALTGTPTTAGSYPFAVSATNSTGTSTTGTITITVAPTPVPPAFTAASPPATGTAGTVYGPYTFTATGTPAPTFSVASGLLPLGLSLSSAGVLSGTPLLAGTSTFTVAATNSAGTANTSTQTITVAATPVQPVLTASSPPTTATAGTAYAGYTFTAFGTPTPTFSVATGSLPAGLSLSPAGVLSGTPTTAGQSTFTVAATNSAGAANSASITITVAPTPVTPAFTAASPPTTGVAGSAYAGYTFAASGVPAPTFSVTSGSLPLGLSLDGTSGQLSGTPLLPGSSTFTVTATNSAGAVNAAPVTITIDATPISPVFFAASPPTTGTAGTAYGPYTFTAVGVPAPTFSLNSGALPTGVTLASDGTLSGTPTTAGTYTFTVAAGNSAGSANTSQLTITVAPTPVGPAFTASTPPGTGTVLTAYHGYTFTATGVPAPTFAVASGSLPTGLSLSSAGVLSGVPITAGTSTFSVSATNSSGAVSTPTRTIVISPIATRPAFINQLPPLTGTVGTAYAPYSYTAVGYPAATFGPDSGTIPPGLSISSAGVLSGTPTTAGTYTFTVAAANSEGSTPSLTAIVVISPAAAGPAFVDQSPPGTGTVGSAYSYTFSASGYPAPTFARAGGTLPTGLTLNPLTGVLSGTPLAAGSYSFTVSATNASGAVSTGSKTIVISPATLAPTIGTLDPVLDATVGMPYLHLFSATGYPAATFSTTDPLPAGLTLSSAGLLSGTPATGSDGTYPITLTATNGTAPDDTRAITLTVDPAPVISIAPLFLSLAPPDATAGTPYSFTFTATGFPAPTYSTTDPLPAGLSLSSAGVLSGTPSTAGTTTFTVTASNGAVPDATQSVTLTVDPAPVAPSFSASNPPDATVLSVYNYTFTASGVPSTMTFTTTDPLPLGVLLLPNGQLTGIPLPSTQGDYPVTVTASNGTAPAATVSLTFHVDPAPAAPAFTSSAPADATEGTAYSHTFTTSGYPVPTYSTTDPLPIGLTLSSAGVLSGTPSSGTAGSYPVTVTASNGVSPAATQAFTLTVDPAPAGPVFTGSAPPAATAGTPYSFTFTASGVPAPTFSTSDPLPVGLSLSSAGVLSGTPAAGAAGDHTFTVTASNGSGPAATRSVTLHVAGAPTAPAFTAASPPAATVGVPYAGYTFHATGNPAPTFTADANLPAGLTLSSAGVLSGTPTAPGSHPFVVTASNGVNPDATVTRTVTVGTVPAFTAATPPLTAATGSPYSYQFQATGYPAVTYATTSQLPLGWSLDANTGVLSSSLPVLGSFTFSVTATNSSGTTTAGPFTITIAPGLTAPVMTDADTEARTATVGTAYPTYQFTANGFPTPTFSVSAGTLPTGLSLSSGGSLSGTPVAAGTYLFTVRAANGVNPAATRNVQIVVDRAPAFTAANPPLTGTSGTPYSYTFAASGSPAPTFATLSQLPAGWNLDPTTGVLSAASPAAGTLSVAVTASNRAGTDAAGPFTISIAQAPAAPALTAAAPPTTATVGSAYGPYTFTASGNPAPTFAVSSGSLPAGLSLDANSGVLSGTPTAAGPATFRVRAHNSAGDDTSAAITVTVGAPATAPGLGSTAAPGGATVGTLYAGFTFTAAGNPAPTFTVVGGSLPPGLTLDPVTGQLSGTPTTGGSYTFRIQADNGSGSSQSGPITIVVAQAPALTAATPPTTAMAGTAYGPYTFTASGYPAPTFAVSAGTLPVGLTLDPATGVLSGTPTATGTSTFRVGATNSAGTDVSAAITVTVAAAGSAPTAPGGVTLSAGVASLVASWSAVAGATSYTVSASPGAATCTTTGTSCRLGGTAGTSYTVRVTAHSDNGDSAASDPSNAATPTAPTVPATVPNDAPATLTTDKGQIRVASVGDQITVIGTGFQPFSTATVVVYSTPTKLADTTTDANGAFSVPTVLPDLPAGEHTFVASGIDPDGSVRMIRLPFTLVATTAKDAGGATTVTVPKGGKITLLDADGHAAVKVRVAQGLYSLDAKTGRIVFLPDSQTFVGTADPVTYQVTDGIGGSVTGTYAAIVHSATGRAALHLPKRVVSSTGSRGSAPVTCRLDHGPLVACTVVATAKVGSKTVVVGRGVRTTAAVRKLTDLEVPVTLTAAGRSLAARPGGFTVRLSATLTQYQHAVTTTTSGRATVIAKTFTLARPINFGVRSVKVGSSPKSYLKAVRPKLAGATVITCTGNGQTRGGDAYTRKLALNRAKAVCAIVAKGLHVKVGTVAKIHQPPKGRQDTAANRARNRRVDVTVTN